MRKERNSSRPLFPRLLLREERKNSWMRFESQGERFLCLCHSSIIQWRGGEKTQDVSDGEKVLTIDYSLCASEVYLSAELSFSSLGCQYVSWISMILAKSHSLLYLIPCVTVAVSAFLHTKGPFNRRKTSLLYTQRVKFPFCFIICGLRLHSSFAWFLIGRSSWFSYL